MLSSPLLQIALVMSSLLFMCSFSLLWTLPRRLWMFAHIQNKKTFPLTIQWNCHTINLYTRSSQATSHQLRGTSSSTTPGLLKAVTSMPRRARLACRPDSSCSGLKCLNHPAGLGAHVVGTQWAGWCWGGLQCSSNTTVVKSNLGKTQVGCPDLPSPANLPNTGPNRRIETHPI